MQTMKRAMTGTALVLLALAGARGGEQPSQVIESGGGSALLRAFCDDCQSVIAHYSVNAPVPYTSPGTRNDDLVGAGGGLWELAFPPLQRGDIVNYWLELRKPDGSSAELNRQYAVLGAPTPAPGIAPASVSTQGAEFGGGSVSYLVAERWLGHPAMVVDSDGKLYSNSQAEMSPTAAPAGSLEITNGDVSLWIQDDGTRQVRVEEHIYPNTQPLPADGLQWVGPHGNTLAVLSSSTGGLFLGGKNYPNDTDGDGIPDAWEESGYNTVDLPAMGANPFRKSVFLEVDWMLQNGTGAKLVRPDAVEDVKTAFLEGTSTSPDGSRGVDLIADYGQGGAFTGGNQVTYDPDLHPGFTDLHVIKSFTPDRERVFHYVVFCDLVEGGEFAGLGQIGGQYLIVALGAQTSWDNRAVQATVLMHELGHTLGLGHGGFEGENHKPNYLSVMNYLFSWWGINHRDGAKLDFSRFYLKSLDEAHLNEFEGIQPLPANQYSLDGYHAAWTNGGSAPQLSPLDWNRNGQLQTDVVFDLNNNGVKVINESHDEWQDLFMGGGLIGTPQTAAAAPMIRVQSLEILDPIDEQVYPQP